MIQYLLLDIEGTISDIRFVKEVLFPYSQKRLESFLLKNESLDGVREQIILLKKEIAPANPDSVTLHDCVQTLSQWIDEDLKHSVLKKIQGMIWKQGFEAGEFQSHLYEDVVPAIKEVQTMGVDCGIYSSGSRSAQELFFKHSIEGDIRGLFKNFFDLEKGSKKEAQSYQNISKALAVAPEEILFVSDVPAELQAAKTVGYKVLHMIREGTERSEFEACESMESVVSLINSHISNKSA